MLSAVVKGSKQVRGEIETCIDAFGHGFLTKI